jgi:23S rRNA (cytosine1962-C5)-methyltransferase
MSDLIKINLKSGKDQSMRRKHPWVFSGAIKKIYGQVAEGDLVEVFDNKDEKLGTGHYQDGSIAVRILNFGEGKIDPDFWNQRIAQAWKNRQEEPFFNLKLTNVFRLINAEGDGLPGLIVDYYNGAVIIQVHSSGMYKNLGNIVEAIKELKQLPIDTIYNKSRNTLHAKPGIVPINELIFGERTTGEVLEYGNQFKVNWERGQKTGFFIDQRENRKLVELYSSGKNVLNMFCFSGGFSVYALRGGASLVHSVDSSGHAIDLARENVEINFPDETRHEAYATDAFEFFQNIDQKYDLIILDPPAFAKHQNVLNNALQGYKRLNQRAIECIRPGGIIFTFSCSQAVSKENFRKSVFAAAANTGRTARVLHQLHQPPDHPVSIYHPEGEYLKGLVIKID